MSKNCHPRTSSSGVTVLIETFLFLFISIKNLLLAGFLRIMHGAYLPWKIDPPRCLQALLISYFLFFFLDMLGFS